MMTVRCDGFFLQAIQPNEFINSVEWKCHQYGQTFSTHQVRTNLYEYCISANSFCGNYSFLEVGVRQLFKGGNYSREETIDFLIFCMPYIPIVNMKKK